MYQLAVDFVGVSSRIARSLPKGHTYISDQLRRAAMSVSLNIAEGAGEFSAKDKARFYRMATRSATECAAVLDICRQIGDENNEVLEKGREQLLSIVSMLITMCRRLPSRGRAQR